ncbi:MAG: UDP-glucose/GDP-mannose dehydrogenase family protein [Candidatus Melainabacteria bacterium]|nr:UDP-glucose/GDP-mannose dehydrogenase family protein [Candidatus Melainabacteria bacterium]
MRIGIVGSGYVGTVTGACMSELGHQVVCADINEARIQALAEGHLPFYEDGLEPLLQNNLKAGRLSFSADIQATVAQSEIVFICVGTPPLPDGRPDTRALNKALRTIAAGINDYKIIVEKSTLPIKTGAWLQEELKKGQTKEVPFDLASVPQFLREGHAVKDFFHPDRIVIGAEKQDVVDTLVNLYDPLNAPMLITDINTAVMIKHATNAFLAMKISFINSLAPLCEHTGADVTQVAKGLGMDNRIADAFLNAGLGYGGIFFPKDIASLLNIADEYHVNLDLLKTTEVINRYQRITFMERVEKALDHSLHGKTIAVWGLAYRPHTDDLRDAPSLQIIHGLQHRGAKIRAFDPLAMDNARQKLKGVQFCNDPYEAAQGADAIAILTEWEAFSQVNFQKLKESTTCRTIVDGRNLLNPKRMAELGFQYVSIGRRTLTPSSAEGVPASL